MDLIKNCEYCKILLFRRQVRFDATFEGLLEHFHSIFKFNSFFGCRIPIIENLEHDEERDSIVAN